MRMGMDFQRQLTWLFVAAVLAVGGYYGYQYLSDPQTRQSINDKFGQSEYRPMGRAEAEAFVLGTTPRAEVERLYGSGRAPNTVRGLPCVRYPLRDSQTRSWRLCYTATGVLASRALVNGQ